MKISQRQSILGVMILLTTVNLAYYQELMAGIRSAIAAGKFSEFCAATAEAWARGDAPSS